MFFFLDGENQFFDSGFPGVFPGPEVRGQLSARRRRHAGLATQRRRPGRPGRHRWEGAVQPWVRVKSVGTASK